MSAAMRSDDPAPQSAALRSFDQEWRAREPDALREWRQQAMDLFLRLGLPTTRDETWRYTNLRRFAQTGFTAAAPSPGAAPAARDGGTPRIAGALYIDVVDGRPRLPSARIAGLEISSLRELARHDAGAVGARLSPPSDADHRRWALLNTALFVDGPLIRIGARLDAPLIISHICSAGGDNAMSFPRVVIETAAGASATIIERHSTAGDAAAFCNSCTQIDLAGDSRLEHYRIFAAGDAATHVDTLDIRQQRASRCRQFTIAIGGELVRTNVNVQLREPGAEFDGYSLLLGHEARHVDCLNIVTHEGPQTRSAQTARSIASGTSRVVFNSKVIVNAGATHAESLQSSRGLLLSPTAEIDTRPQLEIHTDEVKCAHGATTGRLDPNMLFYLLSRGIDRATAQSLLVYAFLADVLAGMSAAETRAAIEAALIVQLPDSHILREFR